VVGDLADRDQGARWAVPVKVEQLVAHARGWGDIFRLVVSIVLPWEMSV